MRSSVAMTCAGSASPSRQSTARRRLAKLSRAATMPGSAFTLASILRMQPPQATPSTARSMWAVPSRRCTNRERSRVSGMTSLGAASVQQHAVLGAKHALGPSRASSITRSHWPAAAGVTPRNSPGPVSLQRHDAVIALVGRVHQPRRGGEAAQRPAVGVARVDHDVASRRRAPARAWHRPANAARPARARPRSRARRRGPPDRSFRSPAPPKVETAARIITAFTPATIAKKATSQTSTVRPVTSFVRQPSPRIGTCVVRRASRPHGPLKKSLAVACCRVSRSMTRKVSGIDAAAAKMLVARHQHADLAGLVGPDLDARVAHRARGVAHHLDQAVGDALGGQQEAARLAATC